MRIFERNLMELATAYIENGVLKKWRFYSEDIKNINRILHEKQYNGGLVTIDELDYIKKFPNIVIVDKYHVQFINFNGKATRY